MSYRRGRSYRRADRLYRSHEQRPPWTRPALMIGLLAVVLGVGMAAMITPHVRTVLDASVSAAAPANHCRNPAVARLGHADRSRRRFGRTGRDRDVGRDGPGRVPDHQAGPGHLGRGHALPVRHRNDTGSHGDHTDAGSDGTGAGRESRLRDHRACAPAECQRAGHPLSAHRPGWPDAGSVRLHRSQLSEPRRLCAGDHSEPGHRRAVGIRATCHYPRHKTSRRTSGAHAAGGAVVTIDFGFNGTDLTQVGATPAALRQGRCVNGLRGSIFGQVSFCHGAGFFRAAFRDAKRRGGLCRAIGRHLHGSRSGLPDDAELQHRSTRIRVTTSPRVPAHGGWPDRAVQPANMAALAGATSHLNGSDNALLYDFLDPALGCTAFTAPDLSQGGAPSDIAGPGRAVRGQAPRRRR